MYKSEQARKASATEFADESKAIIQESVFKKMLRFLFPDQRKQSRFAGPPLMAYLGTMRGSRPFEVGDVGLGGFSLLTRERWEPGTEMPITLQRMNVAEDERNRPVWSTVVEKKKKVKVCWTLHNSRWKEALFQALK